jgi:hypothetical protein
MIGRQKNNTPAQEGNPSRLPKSLLPGLFSGRLMVWFFIFAPDDLLAKHRIAGAPIGPGRTTSWTKVLVPAWLGFFSAALKVDRVWT